MSDRGPAARTVVEGRYQLEAPLERWGLGEAWQARDKNFRSRSVVLKFFPGVDAARLEDAAQELRAQRSLKHPQVMAVLAQGVHDGVPWVAYDGFEGTPLARLLDDERRAKPLLDAGRARDLFEKVLDAFTAAHEAATPVLHGCLQPASVLVGKTSVKVLDFGLGSLAGNALGVFRAPELGPDASATVAGDVYALGVTLCELLLPPRALEAFLGSLVRDGVAAGRAHRPEIDTSLWDAVARAIARDPAARFADVASLRAALVAAWNARPPGAPGFAPIAPQHGPSLHAVTPGRAPTQAPAPPPAAFSAPLPPPAAPAFSAPVAPATPAFVRPPTLAIPAAQSPLRAPTQAGLPAAGMLHAPPVQPSPWDAPPSYPPTPPVAPAPVEAAAWATLTPATLAASKAALSSAWDPQPEAAVAQSPWATPAARDADWDEETRNAPPAHAHVGAPLASMPKESTVALDLDAALAVLPREATAAFDLDSLGAVKATPATPSTRTSRPPGHTPSGDDWKDSVVVLDMSETRPATFDPPDDDDLEVPEPGSRTRVASPSVDPLDSMATVKPARRPAGVDAYLAGTPTPVTPRASAAPYDDLDATAVASARARPPTLAPPLPQRPQAFAPAAPMPVSEHTMAMDIPAEPQGFATMPAPVHASVPAPVPQGAPAWGLPPVAPAPAAPAKAPSKAPIVIASVVAVLFIAAAVVLVLSRT